MTKKKKSLIRWFGKKFQIIVYHGKSYAIIRKMRFNRFGLIMFLASIFITIFVALAAVVVYTPVKQFIPGYPDKETRHLIYENALRTDSLVAELEKRDVYMEMLRDVLFNDVPIDEDYVVPVENLTDEQIKEFNNPKNKRQTIEDKTTYSVNKAEALPDLFPPVKGIIISSYNKAMGHLGTDIASAGETMIAATLRGVIVMSDYTVKTGYTIIIQHKYNLVSVYKHNKSSFVKSGQFVETGEVIALYGDSGENSNGEHLHFELWRNGLSLNPEDYIIFE
ncbi:MAG: M23 family metallopeptidase [Bacteroidales bacterium]|nr:M23 family metallopeptidase [Bacteroidales bacterium]MDD4215818.1 M23 family metallopeptidase [Bacteroidales bacterium]MDY0142764.1 M23 family metallopeptidase [Bacteroidales bacterium]